MRAGGVRADGNLWARADSTWTRIVALEGIILFALYSPKQWEASQASLAPEVVRTQLDNSFLETYARKKNSEEVAEDLVDGTGTPAPLRPAGSFARAGKPS